MAYPLYHCCMPHYAKISIVMKNPTKCAINILFLNENMHVKIDLIITQKVIFTQNYINLFLLNSIIIIFHNFSSSCSWPKINCWLHKLLYGFITHIFKRKIFHICHDVHNPIKATISSN